MSYAPQRTPVAADGIAFRVPDHRDRRAPTRVPKSPPTFRGALATATEQAGALEAGPVAAVPFWPRPPAQRNAAFSTDAPPVPALSIGAAPSTIPPLWSGFAAPPTMTARVTALGTPATVPIAARPKAQIPLHAIRGFDQTNPAEYDSPAQHRTWALATCSAAALTAVLRATGQKVRIADVMREMPGGMTPQVGLVSRPSLVRAAGRFGLEARDDVVGYDALRKATESGQPVLVSIRNARFREGHWIVVTGVDSNGVRVADSSRYDLTQIPKNEFMSAWNGTGIRILGFSSAEEAPVPGDAPEIAQATPPDSQA